MPSIGSVPRCTAHPSVSCGRRFDKAILRLAASTQKNRSRSAVRRVVNEQTIRSHLDIGQVLNRDGKDRTGRPPRPWGHSIATVTGKAYGTEDRTTKKMFA